MAAFNDGEGIVGSGGQIVDGQDGDGHRGGGLTGGVFDGVRESLGAEEVGSRLIVDALAVVDSHRATSGTGGGRDDGEGSAAVLVVGQHLEGGHPRVFVDCEGITGCCGRINRIADRLYAILVNKDVAEDTLGVDVGIVVTGEEQMIHLSRVKISHPNRVSPDPRCGVRVVRKVQNPPVLGPIHLESTIRLMSGVVIKADPVDFSLRAAAEVKLQNRVGCHFVGEVDLLPAVACQPQRCPIVFDGHRPRVVIASPVRINAELVEVDEIAVGEHSDGHSGCGIATWSSIVDGVGKTLSAAESSLGSVSDTLAIGGNSSSLRAGPHADNSQGLTGVRANRVVGQHLKGVVLAAFNDGEGIVGSGGQIVDGQDGDGHRGGGLTGGVFDGVRESLGAEEVGSRLIVDALAVVDSHRATSGTGGGRDDGEGSAAVLVVGQHLEGGQPRIFVDCEGVACCCGGIDRPRGYSDSRQGIDQPKPRDRIRASWANLLGSLLQDLINLVWRQARVCLQHQGRNSSHVGGRC